MGKLKLKSILLSFFSLCMIVNAQGSSQVGTSMANFLKIGAGSRAAAMGEAFVAMTDDASATYWNPGGLVFVEKNEALFQSTSWFANTNLYFISIAIPFDDLGTIGANVYSFDSGDMEETTISQPDGTGRTFKASNFSIGLSYARSFTEQFSIGFTVKYVSENLSRESASTIAVDIGSVFKTNILNGMRIGLALSNLGGTMELGGPDLNVSHDINTGLPTNKFVSASLGTEEWQLPLLFRVGLGTYIMKNETSSILFMLLLNTEAMYSDG